MRIKAARTVQTHFMPVDEGAMGIVADWVHELEREHLWDRSGPLLPSTEMGLDAEGGFVALSLARRGWARSEPVREIVRRAFAGAGLPYSKPQSFRHILVRDATTWGLSPER